ncbi:MAG: hypothetical protein GX055_03230, partial [Desulfovibrionales bacterium]|nr:hypothetical protein [Desulfovibrionales bacterium]
AQTLSTDLEHELIQLGFSEHLQVMVEFRPQIIHAGRVGFALAPDADALTHPSGQIAEQRPRFFWVPNPGLEAQPLDRIASGGELSRFLLAVVSLRAKEQLPALLFDEVDSGIGGQTLIKVAERIRILASQQQVILITHWPQLARLADEHFAIRKEVHDGTTFTLCTRLADEDRQQELQRMAGETAHNTPQQIFKENT